MRKYLSVFLLPLIAFAVAGLWHFLPESRAAGNTYYVVTTGSDSNAGTEASPFRSLERGVKILKTGDTLLVKNGTYTADWGYGNPPGGTSWANPVTIKAYPGHHPVIKAVSKKHAVLFIGTQYIILDGFIIDATGGHDGVKVTWGSGYPLAHHIRIQNNEIKNAPNQGILGCGVGSEILRNKIHDNGSSDFTHGIYCASKDLLVDGNDVYRNAGWGIHIYSGGKTGGPNIIVRNNRSHDNARLGKRGPGMIIGGQGTLAYNNIVWNNNGGIQVMYSGARDIRVFNNTIYANQGYGIIVSNAPNTQLKNNIIYQNTGKAIDDRGGNTGLVQLNNLTSDPKFVNASTRDFHLQSGSPAINAGTALPDVPCDFDGNKRPGGSSYDTGAFEFGSSLGGACS